jgi:hypothetical protein
MLQRTLSHSNAGPRTSQPAWRCTPRAGARGWSRWSWPRASASSLPVPGRGIGSWNERSSAAAWPRATAPSAASSAGSVEAAGDRGGVPVRPFPRPTLIGVGGAATARGGRRSSSAMRKNDGPALGVPAPLSDHHQPSGNTTLAHRSGPGRGSASTLRCRLGPCTQPARPIRAGGRSYHGPSAGRKPAGIPPRVLFGMVPPAAAARFIPKTTRSAIPSLLLAPVGRPVMCGQASAGGGRR